MSAYNHLFSIGFSVESDQKDPEKITERELLLALFRRVREIRQTSEVMEAVAHVDTETGATT